MANPPDVDVEIGRIEPPSRSRNPAEAGSQVGRGPAGGDTRADMMSPDLPPSVSAAVRGSRHVADAGVGSRPALPPADRMADAIDLVGRHVGRAIGYLRGRTPAEMRADVERAIVDNAVLALTAALGLGYLVGRQVRR